MILDSFTKSLRIFFKVENRMASSTASSDHFLYFAFGSNLLTERIHINNPSARFKCVAKLDDYKLTFNHYSKRWQGSVATIMEDKNSNMYGIVWELQKEHLKTLDEQEGVPHNVYKRINVQVQPVGSNETIDCVSYQLLPERFLATGSKAKPSFVYKDVIIRGAMENKLPDDYIDKLKNIEDNGYNDLPFKMSEKKIDYIGKMILAPMVKIGTLPTRLLAIDYGADLVYTEEIIDWRLLRSKRIENDQLETVDYIDQSDDTLVLRIAPKKEKGKLVLQIGTSDKDRAVKVAKMVENDIDAIDVNMGCPKSFSMKGGMGAALLTHPEKIKAILTALVKAVRPGLAVTCKIRILPDLQDTLNLIDVIQSTGVSAVGVHGRTKDERPNHPNHLDVLQKVSQHCKIPMIANGGSANTRDSPINTYQGIRNFWKETGADSVMIARAAEWNPSVFSPNGKSDIYQIVDKYLDYAIKYDQPFIISKYNIQQHLGGDQETPLGKKFLAAATMQELAAVFGKEKQFLERQETLRNSVTNQKLVRREKTVRPQKRKLCELEADDLKIDEQLEELTEMYCPFVRGHYENNIDVPKSRLYEWLRKEHQDTPKYHTWQKDKMFRSIVLVNGQAYSSESWEKNKRYSEQAAAIVALHCLGIRTIQLDKGASTGSGIVYISDNLNVKNQ